MNGRNYLADIVAGVAYDLAMVDFARARIPLDIAHKQATLRSKGARWKFKKSPLAKMIFHKHKKGGTEL